ncbi:MAG TPA: cytochrome c [Byssovorax sp.]|jgi:cytochrome c
MNALNIGILAGAVALGLGFGCATPESPPAATPMTTPPTAAGESPAAAQIARGQQVFAQKCAKCHGAGGEGGKDAPALVGAKALPLDPPPGAKHRTAKFHTGADVATFVKANMPGDAPGTLTDEELTAVLAFDLKANGVNVGKVVDPQVAAGVVLHP